MVRSAKTIIWDEAEKKFADMKDGTIITEERRLYDIALKAIGIARSYEEINRKARRHVEEMRSINNEYTKGYAKGYDQALWDIKQHIFNYKVYGSDVPDTNVGDGGDEE